MCVGWLGRSNLGTRFGGGDELELVIADILATAKKLNSPDGLAWEKTIKEVGQEITSTCYIWGEPYKLQEMLKNTFTYFKSFDKK